jgi:uncharacterized membrane protein (DUF106 family)
VSAFLEFATVQEELNNVTGAHNSLQKAMEEARRIGDEEIIEHVEKQLVVVKDLLNKKLK